MHTQYGPKVQFFEYQSVYIDLLNQQTNEITGNPLDENDVVDKSHGRIETIHLEVISLITIVAILGFTSAFIAFLAMDRKIDRLTTCTDVTETTGMSNNAKIKVLQAWPSRACTVTQQRSLATGSFC